MHHWIIDSVLTYLSRSSADFCLESHPDIYQKVATFLRTSRVFIRRVTDGEANDGP